MVVWGENGSLVNSHKWSPVPTTPSREAALIEMPVSLPWTASHAREPRCRAGTLRLLTEAGHGRSALSSLYARVRSTTLEQIEP
jgi:hypothetical protein